MGAADDLPKFIRTQVRSVWALELLLLVRRTAPRAWAAQELCDELRANLPICASALERFERAGLVVADEARRYRYAPAGAVLQNLVARLEHEYGQRPVTVINLIAAPEDRVQELADAFRFRRDHRP